jgi:hypothetical protein
MSMNWDPETQDDNIKNGAPVMAGVSYSIKEGKKSGPEIVKNEEVARVTVPTPHAVVGFDAGFTLKLGNFEMARVDVRISYPCAPTLEAVGQTYEFCKTWVAQRLQTEVEEIRNRPIGGGV